MPTSETGHAATDSREVLVVSMRGHHNVPAYTAWYEFEDLIVEWENADILDLPVGFRSKNFTLPRKIYQLLRAAGAKESTALKMTWSPDLEIDKSYDLIVLTVSSIFDSFAARQLRSLLSPTGKLVGIAIETWPSEVDQRATDLEPLGLFDQFYVSLPSGAAALSDRLGSAVKLLLPGGDVLATRAHPDHGRRPIAIANPGRRSSAQHKRLLEASIADSRPYIFDTLAGASVIDHREHRAQYNRILGQSDLLICNYAKFNREDVIQGVKDVPGRAFEGLAAGNVLVGELPSEESLADCGLSDINSLRMGLDGKGLNLLEVLKDEPQMTHFKRENQRIAARSHDWVHRWSEILSDAGLEKPAVARDRSANLEELALTI